MALLEHLVAPLRCPGCDATVPSLCTDCRDELTLWTPRSCLRCGAAHPGECFCRLLPDPVVEVRSRWVFDGLAADLVEEAKYRGRTWPFDRLRAELSGWLTAVALQASPDGSAPPLIWVPVPPTPSRLRRTGFDLAITLARWGARVTGGRGRLRALHRRPGRPAQATLDRRARLEAVQGVFAARGPLPEADVVLVDDVITTGATVAACAGALADAGARSLRVVSVARTPRRHPGSP